MAKQLKLFKNMRFHEKKKCDFIVCKEKENILTHKFYLKDKK